MSWIVRNLITNSENIRSNLVDKIDTRFYSLDLENEQYNDLLTIEKKIKELYDIGFITDIEFEILNLMSQGKTYRDVGKIVGLHRQPVKIFFHRACEKIAFNLGGTFTDEGYAQSIVDKYSLNEDQIQKMLDFMKG